MSDVASKINGIGVERAAPLGAGRAADKTRDAASGRSGESGGSPAAAADVRITSSASNLAALEKSVQDMPAIDEARVAQIRSDLEAGRYQVQPERLAHHLVQMEQALSVLGGPQK
jgi:flagellar biosynthesis anti-sigma factor FlgM